MSATSNALFASYVCSILQKPRMMKKLLFSILVGSLLSMNLYSQGVVFEQDTIAQYFKFISTDVSVEVENQVAITKTLETFVNTSEDSVKTRYAFPLPEGASATKLRFFIASAWYAAQFTAIPQDTATGGGGTSTPDYKLIQHLGRNPLYYTLDSYIHPLDTITIELTYVELLPYKFGNVSYVYSGDYTLIDEEIIPAFNISFHMKSARTITDIVLLSHTASSVVNNGNEATVVFSDPEASLNVDFLFQYSLSLDELGLFSLSTYIADTLRKDDYGRGFFAFIAEPDPDESIEVISKVFTLIIDRSGSMSGNKIVQARDAAKFIVNQLNDDDLFNIVSFSDEVSSFRSGHVENTAVNRDGAESYINSLNAGGSTNISGAFDTAIPQFSITDNSKANIIIFFTDGEQTSGITNTESLIEHINNLIISSEKDLSLFTFGIGSSTNERLLTTIAADNNGLSEYLKDSELENIITDFYLLIKNPVLLNTEISISPDILKELYPVRLPNLYQGQQMLVVGRYPESVPVTLALSGKAYSQDVNYNYSLELASTMIEDNSFLTKIWAKMKIDALMENYYKYSHISDSTEQIKEAVTKVSLDYGVISPFTSFQGYEIDDPIGGVALVGLEALRIESADNKKISNPYIRDVVISPIPCNEKLNISFTTENIEDTDLSICLLGADGRMILQRNELVTGDTSYNFILNIGQLNLAPGIYILILEINGLPLTLKVLIE